MFSMIFPLNIKHIQSNKNTKTNKRNSDHIKILIDIWNMIMFQNINEVFTMFYVTSRTELYIVVIYGVA